MITHSLEEGDIFSQRERNTDVLRNRLALSSLDADEQHWMRGFRESNLLQRWSRDGSENARHVSARARSVRRRSLPSQ